MLGDSTDILWLPALPGFRVGLAPETARGYADAVRPFLAGREDAGELGLADLTAVEVTAFRGGCLSG